VLRGDTHNGVRSYSCRGVCQVRNVRNIGHMKIKPGSIKLKNAGNSGIFAVFWSPQMETNGNRNRGRGTGLETNGRDYLSNEILLTEALMDPCPKK